MLSLPRVPRGNSRVPPASTPVGPGSAAIAAGPQLGSLATPEAIHTRATHRRTTCFPTARVRMWAGPGTQAAAACPPGLASLGMWGRSSNRYSRLLSLKPFSLSGPAHCSGLSVKVEW
jgi:hypothetical protein